MKFAYRNNIIVSYHLFAMSLFNCDKPFSTILLVGSALFLLFLYTFRIFKYDYKKKMMDAQASSSVCNLHIHACTNQTKRATSSNSDDRNQVRIRCTVKWVEWLLCRDNTLLQNHNGVVARRSHSVQYQSLRVARCHALLVQPISTNTTVIDTK